jgi:hypothetical protein
VLARPRARLTIKIRSKNIIYPHRHFTEHLVCMFEESPLKNNLNHESSSFFCSDDSRVIPRYPYNNPSHNTNAIEENTSWEEQSSVLRLTKASSNDAWPLGRTSAPAANRWRQKDLVPGTLAPGLRSPRKLEQVTNQALRRVTREEK